MSLRSIPSNSEEKTCRCQAAIPITIFGCANILCRWRNSNHLRKQEIMLEMWKCMAFHCQWITSSWHSKERAQMIEQKDQNSISNWIQIGLQRYIIKWFNVKRMEVKFRTTMPWVSTIEYMVSRRGVFNHWGDAKFLILWVHGYDPQTCLIRIVIDGEDKTKGLNTFLKQQWFCPQIS